MTPLSILSFHAPRSLFSPYPDIHAPRSNESYALSLLPFYPFFFLPTRTQRPEPPANADKAPFFPMSDTLPALVFLHGDSLPSFFPEKACGLRPMPFRQRPANRPFPVWIQPRPFFLTLCPSPLVIRSPATPPLLGTRREMTP